MDHSAARSTQARVWPRSKPSQRWQIRDTWSPRKNPAGDVTRPESCGPCLPSLVEDQQSNILVATELEIGVALEVEQPDIPEPAQFHTWKDLVQATVTSVEGLATSDACRNMGVDAYIATERLLQTWAQKNSFPATWSCYHLNRQGEWQRAVMQVWPIPSSWTWHTRSQDFNQSAPPSRNKAGINWIQDRCRTLHGQDVIQKHQHSCQDFRPWLSRPSILKIMPSRLHICKLPFYSTLFHSIPREDWLQDREVIAWPPGASTSNWYRYLPSLRQFIARRGTPFKLLWDWLPLSSSWWGRKSPSSSTRHVLGNLASPLFQNPS